jgi:hypothetical protein
MGSTTISTIRQNFNLILEWCIQRKQPNRDYQQVIAQPDPLGFLPSVIIEEGRGETTPVGTAATPMEPTATPNFFFLFFSFFSLNFFKIKNLIR